jgi:hypothetical protein
VTRSNVTGAGTGSPILVGYLPGPEVLLQGPCTSVLLAAALADPVVLVCWPAVLAAEDMEVLLDLLAASAVTAYAVVDRREGGRLRTVGGVRAWTWRAATGTSTWSTTGSAGLDGVDVVVLGHPQPPSTPPLPLLGGVVAAAAVHVPLTWAGAAASPQDPDLVAAGTPSVGQDRVPLLASAGSTPSGAAQRPTDVTGSGFVDRVPYPAGEQDAAPQPAQAAVDFVAAVPSALSL